MAILAAYVVPHPPLIVPSVGRGQEEGIRATIDAYEKVASRIRMIEPDTIVITSPHAPLYRDAFFVSEASRLHGDMSQFRAPFEALEVTGDPALARVITSIARQEYELPIVNGPGGMEAMDHATFVPLYFIRDLLPEVSVVRIGLSGLSAQSHCNLGHAINDAVNDCERRVVFIASGDLSHKLLASGPYGFDPAGPLFDQAIEDIFRGGILQELFMLDEDMCDDAAECGLRSFWIMAGALGCGIGGELGYYEGGLWKSELLSHEGPFGVGYAVAALEPADGDEDGWGSRPGIDDAAEGDGEAGTDGDAVEDPASSSAGENTVDPYVALARASVETFVKTGHKLKRPKDMQRSLLNRKAGVFVSLHKGDDLRGCIGTITPACNSVADEIIRNGVLAATEDPRFAAVTEDELDDLSYFVDVLAKPEPIEDASMLDPKRYGVIVTKGWHRGLLLPNLEGVDTVEDQLAIAKRKAGLSPFEPDVELERFGVIRHTIGGEARSDKTGIHRNA